MSHRVLADVQVCRLFVVFLTQAHLVASILNKRCIIKPLTPDLLSDITNAGFSCSKDSPDLVCCTASTEEKLYNRHLDTAFASQLATTKPR